jgi:periplasmic divalent cation tolerance protein
MTDVSIIYITTKNTEEAERIGSVLVEERIVACVNIVEKIISRYWWEGKTVRDEESLLIAKTKRTLVPAVIERVKSIHSYTCPCIVALPIEDGNGDFLSWIRNETR